MFVVLFTRCIYNFNNHFSLVRSLKTTCENVLILGGLNTKNYCKVCTCTEKSLLSIKVNMNLKLGIKLILYYILNSYQIMNDIPPT